MSKINKSAQLYNSVMEETCHDQILESIKNHEIYNNEDRFLPGIITSTNVTLTPNSQIKEALTRAEQEKVCILNFASYRHCGGGYMNGDDGREEELCRYSALYNILEACSEYYEWNNKHRPNNLYLNRALYTSNVPFFNRDTMSLIDVVSCSAPNYAAAKKHDGLSREDECEVLNDRAEFLLSIINTKNIDTLILGDWGCNSFGCHCSDVCDAFMCAIKKGYASNIKNIVFAIPNGTNYLKFEKAIKETRFD